MADVRAFRGLHYNLAKVHLTEVISPPYDVISSEQRLEYLGKSPLSVVRLILPEGEDPYAGAKSLLETWIEQEILIQDREPRIYCYHQTFRTPDGEEKTRKGFMALVRLEDFNKGIVLPHEATLFAPKEDRLNLLRACKTNFSPIFGLYSDPEQKIYTLLEPATYVSPDAQAVDQDGISNSMWCITDSAVIQQVQELMLQHWILIADGHHRYESCLVYRDEMDHRDSQAPYHFTLMFLTNIHHPGIAVLPYNRGVWNLPKFDPASILRKTGKYFEIREFDEQELAFFALGKEGVETSAFLTLLQGMKGFYLFRMKPHVKLEEFYPSDTPQVMQRLDVNILHKILLEGVLSISEEDIQQQKYLKYYKDSREEKKDFEAGRLQIAFFLNPTRVDQVVEVSKAGRTMPQKSTYFFPKLMTGFVMNKHD